MCACVCVYLLVYAPSPLLCTEFGQRWVHCYLCPQLSGLYGMVHLRSHHLQEPQSITNTHTHTHTNTQTHTNTHTHTHTHTHNKRRMGKLNYFSLRPHKENSKVLMYSTSSLYETLKHSPSCVQVDR